MYYGPSHQVCTFYDVIILHRNVYVLLTGPAEYFHLLDTDRELSKRYEFINKTVTTHILAATVFMFTSRAKLATFDFRYNKFRNMNKKIIPSLIFLHYNLFIENVL